MLQLDDRTQQLIQHLWRGGTWGYFWTLDRATSKKVTHWLPTDKASQAPNSAKLDTYFGVNPTAAAKNQHERALLGDVVAVNCLFAEFDGKDYSSKDDALRYVESLQPEPSIIIDSGGGYHLYWMLKDTFEIRNDQERQYIRDVLARWVEFVKGDVVKDLARVLRVPGTHNYKPEYGPKAPLVTYVSFDLTRQYALEELARLLPPVEEKTAAPKPQSPLLLTDGELITRIRNSRQGTKFGALFDRGEIVGYKSQSEADAALCSILIGWTQGDTSQADRLFRQSALFRPEKWDSARGASTYGALTLDFSLSNATWFYEPHAPTATNMPPLPEEPPWEYPETLPPSPATEVPYMPQSEQPKVESAGWRWLTLTDAYAERPAREYVVEKLLPIPSLSALYGAPGGLKTMLVMDMAMAILAGHPFLDPLPGMERVSPFITTTCPIMWVDVDNGERRSLDRMKALAGARGLPEDAPFYFVSFPTPPFVASKLDSVDFIIENAIAGEVKLVVFDNLGTISGGADENSAQMVEVMSGLRQIAERANCAVVVIHHRNKGNAIGNTRKGNSLRGHSSIEGALDLALLVDRTEGEDVVTIESTKTRDIPVWPFEAMWTYNQDEAGELIGGRFYGLGRPEKDDESRPSSDRAYEYIIMELDGEMSQTDIVNKCKGAKIGRNTTLTVLEQIEREKLAEVTRGDRNAKIYQLSMLGKKRQREILYNK